MGQLRKKNKLPKLDYQKQNHIQDIAINNGTILTYRQMQEFAQYRSAVSFGSASDKQILWVIMTPAQREKFDKTRF